MQEKPLEISEAFSLVAGRARLDQDAANGVLAGDDSKGGDAGGAFGAPQLAARFEGAAGRQNGELWDSAGNWRECATLQGWRGFQKALCVRMPRLGQDFARGTFFDDAACVHYYNAIGDLRDYA